MDASSAPISASIFVQSLCRRSSVTATSWSLRRTIYIGGSDQLRLPTAAENPATVSGSVGLWHRGSVTTGACPECGLDRSTLTPADTIAALLSLPSRYTAAVVPLASAGNGLATRRPSESVWSATEYTAHAADALRFICERAELILGEDDPELPRFGDPDGRDYSAIGPDGALATFMSAALALAETLEAAEAAAWERTGHNELGSRNLLETATYAVHEGVHHLHDVERVAAEVLKSAGASRGSGALLED